ncbi:uncharacterized protein LOC144542375 [Centroberyx gerrardi]
MVYENNLMQLFRTCPTCTRTCQIETFVVGTLLSVTQICSHYYHKKLWKSQPYIGNIPAGNLQLSAAVAFNGASYIQIHKVLSSLRLECMCPRTYFSHQRAFLQPAILWQWRAEQQQVIERAKQSGKPVTLGGDMRADSPDCSLPVSTTTKMRTVVRRAIWMGKLWSGSDGRSTRRENTLSTMRRLLPHTTMWTPCRGCFWRRWPSILAHTRN